MLMQSTLDEHIGIDDEISEDLLPIKNMSVPLHTWQCGLAMDLTSVTLRLGHH